MGGGGTRLLCLVMTSERVLSGRVRTKRGRACDALVRLFLRCEYMVDEFKFVRVYMRG